MTGYVGTSAGRKQMVALYVGTPSGRKEVTKAWVGDATGVPRLWYQKANPISLTGTANSSSKITLTWTAVTGATKYTLTRTDGSTTTTIYSGAALTFQDTGLNAGWGYAYTVTASTGDTASTKTDTQDATYTTKTIELSATTTATYNGSGTNRGIAEMYYGYYSSTQGQQKSLALFSVPAEVRNCYSIDRIDLAFYNVHAYQNSGGTTSLIVTASASLGAAWPGASNPFLLGGSVWRMGTPKPGWMTNGNNSGAWMTNCQNLTNPVSGRTLAEEFRTQGATGVGLSSASSGTSEYGYAAGASSGTKPAMKITYRILANP